jgi:hypothetical protein
MTRGTHSWVLEACCAAPALPPLISDLAVNPMIGLSYEPNPKLRKINDEHSFMQPCDSRLDRTDIPTTESFCDLAYYVGTL